MLMKDQLPAFVLAELFSNSLVCTGENLRNAVMHEELPKQKNNYLGNYERKIIVLIDDSRQYVI
jgi:hypothetical protein